jgi:hypothetical protein
MQPCDRGVAAARRLSRRGVDRNPTVLPNPICSTSPLEETPISLDLHHHAGSRPPIVMVGAML